MINKGAFEFHFNSGDKLNHGKRDNHDDDDEIEDDDEKVANLMMMVVDCRQ